MNKLHTALAMSSLVMLSACSSAPERGDNGATDKEVVQDTAPGLENQDKVEVLSAGKEGANAQAQDIGEGQTIDDMKMVDVDSIYEPVVYFDYDQYQLDEKALDNVRYHADILLAKANQKVVLFGHTDERGTPEYNLALGEKRAKAVEQALMLFGVNQNNIEVITYGEEQPQVVGSNETAWAQNRRVEIVIK